MRGRQRSRRRQIVAVGGGAPGSLDAIDRTTIKCAYSMVRLFSAYNGYLLKVRRSSDSATLDVGWDATGALDTDAISTFIGVGTAFVDTWYDQGPTGYNLVQATAADQPGLTLASASWNNKPVAAFVAAGTQFMEADWLGTTVAQPNDWFVAYSNNVTFAYTIDTSTAAVANNARQTLLDNGNGDDPAMYGGSGYVNGTNAGSGPAVACASWNGASSALYYNASGSATATGSPGTNPARGLRLGSYWGNTGHMTGAIAEVVMLTGAASAGNRATIMSTVGARNGITVTP